MQTQPPARENPLLIPDSWGLVVPIGDYRTSLDEDSKAGADRLFAFLNGDGSKPEEMVNIIVPATDISIMPIQKIDGDEIVNLPRVAVHHAGGGFTDFRSGGVLKSLGFICKRYGQPPWNPPLKLKLTRIQVGSTPNGAPKYMYRYAVPQE